MSQDQPRPILPHPASLPKRHGEPSASQWEVPKRSRIGVRVACNQCRAKKAAVSALLWLPALCDREDKDRLIPVVTSQCDGKQPACTQCVKRQCACIYRNTTPSHQSSRALKSQVQNLKVDPNNHTELLNYLKSAPNAKALEALRLLQSADENPIIVSSFKNTPYQMQQSYRPSEHEAARRLLPSFSTPVEFELALRHQFVYPTLIPVDTASIPSNSLLKSTAYLLPGLKGGISTLKEPSEVLATALSSPGNAPPQIERAAPEIIHEESASPPPGYNAKTPRAAGPPQEPLYCDDRLNQLEIGLWTAVPLSNELAAAIISFYLEVDHPLLGYFDADLFLTDLIDHRLRFCSPLLVSSFLFYACVGSAHKYVYFDDLTLWNKYSNHILLLM